mmetsp:Transcript_7187/g.13228  ORF Transcript_7187/g.13228 Transcript_7187/m.13228 type:complete len:265 (-) Transcript_7187:156-950(-)
MLRQAHVLQQDPNQIRPQPPRYFYTCYLGHHLRAHFPHISHLRSNSDEEPSFDVGLDPLCWQLNPFLHQGVLSGFVARVQFVFKNKSSKSSCIDRLRLLAELFRQACNELHVVVFPQLLQVLLRLPSKCCIWTLGTLQNRSDTHGSCSCYRLFCRHVSFFFFFFSKLKKKKSSFPFLGSLPLSLVTRSFFSFRFLLDVSAQLGRVARAGGFRVEECPSHSDLITLFRTRFSSSSLSCLLSLSLSLSFSPPPPFWFSYACGISQP